VLLQDRLKKGKERLDNALEALALLCEPVEPPKGRAGAHPLLLRQHRDPRRPEGARTAARGALQGTAALVRAYANIADELARPATQRGHRPHQATARALPDLREIIRKASGETLDLKAYEADMRHLIDTYIEADEPRRFRPSTTWAAGPDREDRHRRGHQQPAGGHEGQQGRRRRDHREQRPQQDHQGAPQRPGLLREDVGAARRDHRRPQGKAIEYEELP
jgi:hypothetical protein